MSQRNRRVVEPSDPAPKIARHAFQPRRPLVVFPTTAGPASEPELWAPLPPNASRHGQPAPVRLSGPPRVGTILRPPPGLSRPDSDFFGPRSRHPISGPHHRFPDRACGASAAPPGGIPPTIHDRHGAPHTDRLSPDGQTARGTLTPPEGTPLDIYRPIWCFPTTFSPFWVILPLPSPAQETLITRNSYP
jgi:hypothetical protein